MIASLAWAAPAAADEFTEVGVVVNVLKGAAPCTDEQIKEALEEANAILHQAKVRLVHKKTNRDVSDGGNDDGRVDPEEGEKLRTSGQEELDSVVGKGKGWKLNISRLCDTSDPAALGAAVHDIPVGITEHPPDKKDFGWVIVHEFCHGFTLTGHRDPQGNEWGTDNVMHPRFGHRGTTLTDAQKAEIKKKADLRGDTEKKAATNTPTQKKGQQGGSAPDQKSGEPGESSGIPPKSDLRRCEMFSDSTAGLMRGDIQVRGLLDPDSVTQVQCFQYIDADANAGTGQQVNIDGRSIGAEFRIEVTITSTGGGTFQQQGRIYNTISGVNIPLSLLELEAQDYHDCFGDSVDQTPLLHQFRVEFPRSFLGTLVLPCAVGVRLTDAIAGTVDEADFDLESHPAPGPTITLNMYLISPGGNVQVTGSGFTPGVDVAILVNDTEVAVALTNGAGGFSLPITGPLQGNTYFWMAGREADGGPSDFTILHTSSPSSYLPLVRAWGLAGIAALLAASGTLAVRRRKA